MPKEKQNEKASSAQGASTKIQQKESLYEAEYLGSGTFKIVKPKRQEAKLRQSRLKGTTRGSRK